MIFMYFPIRFFVASPYLNIKNETRKNLKNLEKKENIINRKILIPIIPEPIQVILYGNGEKPPMIINIIPIS